MRIGEVAEKAGASVRALRHYEEQDLLHAFRPAASAITPTPPSAESD
ncbi:MerR family DNA-binding transcriptional regulator [Streptomyces sp. 8K308]